MPHFLVTKAQDAYVNYETVVEADDAQTAQDAAGSRGYGGKWLPSGVVNEFDDSIIVEELTEEVKPDHVIEEFVALEVAPEQRDMMAAPVEKAPEVITGLDDAEHATVLAALRFYQANGMGDPFNRSDEIHEIATNGGTVLSSLDDEGIDALCERINHG